MLIVSKVLKFAALYPDHLDLNGDHGNLLVLKQRLKWRGVQADIIQVDRPVDLDSFDLVLLGHGSTDAWLDVQRMDPHLVTNVAALVRAGKPVMAVSSGYERLITELESISIDRCERVSEFRDIDGVVGYVNSDAVLPEIRTVMNCVLTLFHGPVLAKNPQLADKIISSANWANIDDKSVELNTVDELAKASRRIAFED